MRRGSAQQHTRRKFSREVCRLQRALFRANERLINQSVEGYTAEFRRYAARYQRTVRASRRAVGFDALLERTRTARLVLVGDYHTLPASQETFIEIVSAQPQDEKLIIGLEILEKRHRPHIEAFQSGRISERTFLSRVRFGERWPFGPFDIFAELFALARRRGHEIVGLDPSGDRSPLGDRDRFAANTLAEALRGAPDRRALALVGDMHLAPGHLPKELTGRGLECLRIHQNPDAVWFDHMSSAESIPEAVELMDGALAVFTASPVVCQQSFLTWLEEPATSEPEVFRPNQGRRLVRQSLRAIGEALSIPIGGLLSGLQVVGPEDLTFIDQIKNAECFSKKEFRQIKRHILSSESCYIPKANMIYLANHSVSHAAEEAAHLLRHRVSGEAVDEPRGLVDAFYSRIMNEAVGFLGSKVVNPKRSCLGLADLEILAGEAPRNRHEALEVTAAQMAVAHKRLEAGVPTADMGEAFSAPTELFNAATHMLGYLLGEQIYEALVEERLSVREVRALFYEPFEEDGSALFTYFDVAGRVRRRRSSLPATAR